MKDYLTAQGTRATPQDRPIPGRTDQVENEAGGYVWQADQWSRLNRFLILGTEGGSYYASERDLTTSNVSCLIDCIREDGPRVVSTIVDVSHNGRAPQNDSALYALAACISLGDRATKSAAAEALPKVARIGTHLYHFVGYAETMRGWGRTMRWAVQNWYDRNPEQLAYQAVKYRQRDGWSHRDLLRLAHPSASNEDTAALFDWITHGTPGSEVGIVEGFERAQSAETPAQTAELVRRYRLPREALKTDHLNAVEVWEAMLDVGMPLHALTRNLATMTRIGVLEGRSRQTACEALTDAENVRKSRLHPLALLVALRTYTAGHGFRGGNTWTPIPDVIDALDEAFYLAFDNVEPTGKRIVLGIDVSGSMGSGGVAGSNLTPREAAVAMALVALHAEPVVDVVGFTDKAYKGFTLSRRQRLDDALRQVPKTGEGTNCAIPAMYARDHVTFDVDAIVLYTDSQSWAGDRHAQQVIEQYRQTRGVPTRQVAVGMVANQFTVCDPLDPLSLNCVGFDVSTPGLIAEFVAGRL